MKTSHPKVKSMRHYSDLVLDQLGIKAYQISVTGSLAWGTDKASSDVDLTVIGVDIRPDVFNYPRQKYVSEIYDGEEKIDVRFFSVPVFLRMVHKSSLIAYESIFGFPLNPGYLYQVMSEEVKNYFSAYDAMMKSKGLLLGLLNKNLDDESVRRKILRFYTIIIQAIALHERDERGLLGKERYPVVYGHINMDVHEFCYAAPHRMQELKEAAVRYGTLHNNPKIFEEYDKDLQVLVDWSGVYIPLPCEHTNEQVLDIVYKHIQKANFYASQEKTENRKDAASLDDVLKRLMQMGYN